MVVKQQNFDWLIDNIYQTHNALQANAKRIINQNLTIRNWLVGYYIVEYEQNGEDRAEYGARLLEEMATTLKAKGIKGLRPRELNTCRKFYTTYPQIWRTVSAISDTELEIVPELLLSRLSYSHFIELLRTSDPLERLFYEVETIKNNWGVRELERAIDTSLFFRTGLSTNKEAD